MMKASPSVLFGLYGETSNTHPDLLQAYVMALSRGPVVLLAQHTLGQTTSHSSVAQPSSFSQAPSSPSGGWVAPCVSMLNVCVCVAVCSCGSVFACMHCYITHKSN